LIYLLLIVLDVSFVITVITVHVHDFAEKLEYVTCACLFFVHSFVTSLIRCCVIFFGSKWLSSYFCMSLVSSFLVLNRMIEV